MEKRFRGKNAEPLIRVLPVRRLPPDGLTSGNFLISTSRSSASCSRSRSIGDHREHQLQAPEAATQSRGMATRTETSPSRQLASRPQNTQNLPRPKSGTPESRPAGEMHGNSKGEPIKQGSHTLTRQECLTIRRHAPACARCRGSRSRIARMVLSFRHRPAIRPVKLDQSYAQAMLALVFDRPPVGPLVHLDRKDHQQLGAGIVSPGTPHAHDPIPGPAVDPGAADLVLCGPIDLLHFMKSHCTRHRTARHRAARQSANSGFIHTVNAPARHWHYPGAGLRSVTDSNTAQAATRSAARPANPDHRRRQGSDFHTLQRLTIALLPCPLVIHLLHFMLRK